MDTKTSLRGVIEQQKTELHDGIPVTTPVRHVSFIVDDLTKLAAVAASLAGHEELGNALLIIERYVSRAAQGWSAAASIEINADTIKELFIDVPLDKPEAQ
jgi:hypothetical protein